MEKLLNVQGAGDGQADDDQDDLRPALVPSGEPVHQLVERALDLRDEAVALRPRRLEGVGHHALEIAVRKAVGRLLGLLHRGGVRGPGGRGHHVEERHREHPRRHVRRTPERIAPSQRPPSVPPPEGEQGEQLGRLERRPANLSAKVVPLGPAAQPIAQRGPFVRAHLRGSLDVLPGREILPEGRPLLLGHLIGPLRITRPAREQLAQPRFERAGPHVERRRDHLVDRRGHDAHREEDEGEPDDDVERRVGREVRHPGVTLCACGPSDQRRRKRP